MAVVNLYRMGQEIIEAKKKFFAVYGGKYEHEYCKLNHELWEEEIIEMEDAYRSACRLYHNEPDEKVLNWNF